MMLHNVAIVVIGRNEGKRLKECLKSCVGKVRHLVYVDSGSTDNSIEVAEGLGVDIIRLHPELPFTAARARNEGFEFLLGQSEEINFVHFIDGDCVLNDEWLAHAKSTLSDQEDIAVIHGRLREKEVKKSIYTRLADISWYREPGMNKEFGGIFTIRSMVFKALEGFNSELIAGEEPDLFKRLLADGRQIICTDHLMGTHDFGISNFKEWWGRSVRTGFAYANSERDEALKNKQLRISFWALFIPILIVILAMSIPNYGAMGLVIYPTQMIRIFLKLNIPYGNYDKLLYAGACVVDNFPQFIGVVKYHCSERVGKKQNIIEYKKKK